MGTFDYNMIVTCKDGTVCRLTRTELLFTGAAIANMHTEAEGPGVAPLGFGFYAGQILLADESGIGWVHAVSALHRYSVRLQRARCGKHPGRPGQSVHLLLGSRLLPGVTIRYLTR